MFTSLFLLLWEMPPTTLVAVLSFAGSAILLPLPWLLPRLPVARMLRILSLASLICLMMGAVASIFLSLVVMMLVAWRDQSLMGAAVGLLVIACTTFPGLWLIGKMMKILTQASCSFRDWALTLPWLLVFWGSIGMVCLTILELFHVIGPRSEGFLDLPNFIVYPLVFLELMLRATLISFVHLLVRYIRR